MFALSPERCGCFAQRQLTTLAVLAALGFADVEAGAGVAETFTYQGVLRVSGTPYTGSADLRFQLFGVATGGSPLGSVVVVSNAALSEGQFAAELDFGAGAFQGDARWVQVSVRTPAWNGVGSAPAFTTLTPRSAVMPAPYAIHALHAASSDDAYWSANGSDIFYTAGKVGIGVTDPADQWVVGAGDHRFSVDLDSDPNYVRIGALANNDDIFSMVSRGDVEIVIDTNNNDNDKVFRVLRNGYGGQANAEELMRVEENGRIGMGTATPGNNTLQVDAQSRAQAVRVDSGVAGGIGIVVNATATTGNSVAGDFSTDSNAGTAVYGEATSTGGVTYGLRGKTNSTAAGAAGVRGEAPASGNTNYGVYGSATGASAYGVYANGRLGASGTKAFMIDHPLDPENEMLLHYSAEGPEVLNIYCGNITLDAKGEAWVELPEYFEAINADPRYQLTPVGAPAPMLHVAERVRGNRFKVAGGAAGMEVSWEIKARRADRFVAQRGAPVEVMKVGAEQGRYIDPTLYGMPEEAGMFYVAPHAAPGSDAKR